MSPDEAQKVLQEAGFYARWRDRSLVGGSTYVPGTPGKFEGLLFTITLLEPGVCQAEVTDFDGTAKPPITEGAEGATDLGAIVQSLVSVLSAACSLLPHTTIEPWLGIQLGQAAPYARSEVEALSRLFMSEEVATEMSETLEDQKLVFPIPPGMTEEQRLALPLQFFREARAKEGQPPVNRGSTRLNLADLDAPEPVPVAPKPPTSRNRVAYRGKLKNEPHLGFPAFYWAPLSARETWPSKLYPFSPYKALSLPRELDLVLLASAIRQCREALPEWLELIVFSTEPVADKVTACFLATKTAVPTTPIPDWLLALETPAERQIRELQERLARG